MGLGLVEFPAALGASHGLAARRRRRLPRRPDESTRPEASGGDPSPHGRHKLPELRLVAWVLAAMQSLLLSVVFFGIHAREATMGRQNAVA